MKSKIILTLLVTLMAVSSSYASFPVQRTVVTTTTAENTVEEKVVLESPAATVGSKDQTTALLLWLFLSLVAAHRWYLGSPIGWNILYILTLGGLGVWWIIDGIDIITDKYPGL